MKSIKRFFSRLHNLHKKILTFFLFQTILELLKKGCGGMDIGLSDEYKHDLTKVRSS